MIVIAIIEGRGYPFMYSTSAPLLCVKHEITEAKIKSCLSQEVIKVK